MNGARAWRVREVERELLDELGARHHLWDGSSNAVVLARGGENTTFAVAGCIVRRTGDRQSLEREVMLLTRLAAATEVPIPVPLAHDAERGLLVYRQLPGTQLLLRDDRAAPGVAAALIEVLTALRRIAPQLDLVPDAHPIDAWHREAVERFTAVRARLDPAMAAVVSAFLQGALPAAPRRMLPVHGDLGAEHILVDGGGRVTGILDWTDAAFADPARDAGLLYRDLGAALAFQVSAAVHGHVDEEEAARIRFHARCKWLEDLAYGFERPDAREAYVANALRTFDSTFDGVPG